MAMNLYPMISKASVKFVRISPRKVRYVIDQIRRKSVLQAQAILNGSPRRAGEIVRKLLNQAVDAAQKNSQVSAESLVVSTVMADGGPTMKRFRAASMGRASVIRKRTSHIYLELGLARGAQKPMPPKVKNVKETSKTVVKAPVKKAAKKMAGAK
jgi:large subunit ribosomal protein L22